MEGVGRMSGGCGPAVWRVWEVYLEVVYMLYDRCGDAVWRVWRRCLKGVERLSEGSM